MQVLGIKMLQTNPSLLTKSLERGEFTLISKRNRPIGIALAFDDTIVSLGLKRALLLEAYKSGYLSLGQLSKELNLSKKDTMKMLSHMGIDVIEYDFSDDLNFIKDFNDSK